MCIYIYIYIYIDISINKKKKANNSISGRLTSRWRSAWRASRPSGPTWPTSRRRTRR